MPRSKSQKEKKIPATESKEETTSRKEKEIEEEEETISRKEEGVEEETSPSNKKEQNTEEQAVPRFVLYSKDGSFKNMKVLIDGRPMEDLYELKIEGDRDSNSLEFEYVKYEKIKLSHPKNDSDEGDE